MHSSSLTGLSFAATLLASLAIAGCGGAPPDADDSEVLGSVESELASSEASSSHHLGFAKAEGAFTCELRLAGDFPFPQVAPVLERDRMIMSRQPGMLHKHIPIAFSPDHVTNGQPDLLGGGRYLFKTAKQAANYREFVTEDFFLDGVQFLQRPEFLENECHNYKVVHAYDFTDLHTTQVTVRTERFTMSGPHAVKRLKDAWHGIFAEAGSRGMAAVWLLFNEDEHIASVVYFHDRIVPEDPNVPDFTSLGFLAGSPPLGHHIEELGWPRTFDRTNWVLTIWLPFVNGDHGEESEWPHSPPFGKPFCADGVCEVSRGENNSTCAADCPVHCGNGVCQPHQGENDHNCPGDCGAGHDHP